jgi:hypothetical protein
MSTKVWNGPTISKAVKRGRGLDQFSLYDYILRKFPLTGDLNYSRGSVIAFNAVFESISNA